MISILGVGSSRPKIGISDGVYTTLKPEYINLTSNKNVAEAVRNTFISTTELAAEAAREAIHSAGIEIDKIGLVLADCSTPVETIPGESQRTASLLGLKVPAYDILSGSTSMLNLLNSLKDWKEERLPEYILYVSVNSPTQRVNFSEGEEKSFFSDAAGALILSSKHAGKFSLQKTQDFLTATELGALKIDLFGHIKLKKEALEENYRECLVHLERELKSEVDVTVISDSYPFITEESCWIKSPSQRNSLSCGIFAMLKNKWESVKKDDTIILFFAALETRGGGLIKLRAEK